MKLYFNFFIRVLIGVLIFYVPIRLYNYSQIIKDEAARIEAGVFEQLARVHKEVKQLIDSGQVLEACERLKAEKSARTIAAYTVISPDMSCYEPDVLAKLDPNFQYGLGHYKIGDLGISMVRTDSRGVDWQVSVLTPQKFKYLDYAIHNPRTLYLMLLDLFQIVIYVFLFVAGVILVQVQMTLNLFKSKDKTPFLFRLVGFLTEKMALKELVNSKAATVALIQKNRSMAKDMDLLETSLEQSILNEIRENNHKIPYTFYGTVAKVDINGFSKVVSSGHSSQSHNLTKFLEDFGCELLQRYNGLFEKTVGDEIVVVFKMEHSDLYATAFARDLMHEFSKVEINLSGELRKFTLKSSISSSQIQFSKRAPGYGFNGDALTYASRLLDMVKDKDRNMLSCMKADAEAVKEIIYLPDELRTFEFKNMKSTEGYLVDQFLNVEQIYRSKPQYLKYFRSDEALTFLLDRIMYEEDLAKVDMVFECFNLTRVRKCSSELRNKWIESIQHYQKRTMSDLKLIFPFSKLIVEGSKLIPKSEWTDECTQTILRIPRNVDGRMNASIIDVLIQKDLNGIALENEKSFVINSDPSFRTRGNLLISKARIELSDEVLGSVRKMLTSENKLEVSTGVFCACSIILLYQTKNPAELEIFSNYRKIIKKLRYLYERSSDLSPRLSDLTARTLSRAGF